jgi:hypothetical protein
MSWYRLERSLGRFSLVGTTVQAAERLPRHLVADEKHTTWIEDKTRKVYLAATAGGGCCLGMALAEMAGADDLTAAYGPFRDEARCLDPAYRPETVNTDGWPATQAAWRALFQGVALILCFLPAFLKIRERAVPMKETFDDLRERVWEADPAPDARSFSQRLRRLREWAQDHVGRRWCGRRCWHCATSGVPSSGRTTTPAAAGQVTSWTGCCGASTIPCTAPNIGTARGGPPSRGCGAGR